MSVHKASFKKEIEELLADEKIWEIVIDEFHLLEIEQILFLAKFMKIYFVEYPRLWIFLQNFVRDYFVNSEDKNFEKDFILIKKFMDIFDDEKIRLEDNVLLQFLYFLRNKKDEMIVKESYYVGKSEMI